MFNQWYMHLQQHAKAILGDLSFIEFTVDASGYEIAGGTPKSSEYFEAPWAIPSGALAERVMPTYISSWEQLYHPDLVERNRP